MERLRISGDALVITPYHQALNRLRELARGDARHGSCGVGIGETVGHGRANPDEAVRVRDLADVALLHRKVARIRDYARAEIETNDEIFEREDVLERWVEEAHLVAPLAADDQAWRDDVVVFEGAQGVLLDEEHGFHPHTTWGTCTSAPARRLLEPFDAEVQTIGILRAYAVRHGAGPLPTESGDVTNTPPEHNTFNEWQGAVRYGWFDAVLARYAIEADGNIDRLAITHLDWLARLERWTYCDAYAVRPVLRHCRASEDAVIETIEELVNKPVAFGSRGPSAAHVFIRPGTSEVSRGADRRREVG
jgi:adenylosuccinate synthase